VLETPPLLTMVFFKFGRIQTSSIFLFFFFSSIHFFASCASFSPFLHPSVLLIALREFGAGVTSFF